MLNVERGTNPQTTTNAASARPWPAQQISQGRDACGRGDEGLDSDTRSPSQSMMYILAAGLDGPEAVKKELAYCMKQFWRYRQRRRPGRSFERSAKDPNSKYKKSTYNANKNVKKSKYLAE